MHKHIYASIMLLLASVAGAKASEQAYRLGAGDEVRIRVFDWRGELGDIHAWPALNDKFTIGSDGDLSLPLLGSVAAAGYSTVDVADTIAKRLQILVKLANRPSASVEVVEYRPFYILGDVGHPGAYPYRPGLTMLQAVSLAGGGFRSDSAAGLRSNGDMQALYLEYAALLVRRARLQAELGQTVRIALPSGLRQGDPTVAGFMQTEQAVLDARRSARQAKLDALDRAKSLYGNESVTLDRKAKTLDQELALVQDTLARTTAMVKAGLAIAPREFTLQQTVLETEGRRLDLSAAALQAKENTERIDREITEFRNTMVTDLDSQLADIEQKLPQIAARISASGAMAVGAASKTNAMTFQVLRGDLTGKIAERLVDGTAPVSPGDTIEVRQVWGAEDPTAMAAATAEGQTATAPSSFATSSFTTSAADRPPANGDTRTASGP